MVKKSKKSKSKRMPLRKKYKIIKRVKEHNKKKVKEAKKQAAKGGKHKVVEKDPGIPSAWPFREQELAALEARRQRALAEKEQKKQEKKERQVKRRAGTLDEDEEAGTSEQAALTNLAKDARQRDAEFDRRKRQKVEGPAGAALKDGSKRAFYKEFQKVLEASDVVIQVLDARDPLGCRCREVERLVLKSGAHKRVILLLNKIDLVPREVAERWLKYLREELPTVAFKCSTQAQKAHLGQARGGAGAKEALGSSQCLGADTLLQLLKNYARNQKLKTSITVGVVGFPNVGKSSLINSLKRTRVANVGSTPGVTKSMQEIHLDKHVKLLDCPGIVFATAGGGEAEAALRNAVRVEQLEDPISPVRQILRLCQPERLMSIYKVARFADVDEFLRHVAASRGKLKKGGVADSLAAARVVLKDWNDGKIPFYSLPPARLENAEHAEAAVVSEWGREFDVEAVFKGEETAVIAGLGGLTDGDFTELPASAEPKMELEGLEGEDDGEEDEEAEDYDGEEEDEDEEDDEDEDETKEPSGSKAMDSAMDVDQSGKPVARGREYLSQTEKLFDADGIYNPKLAKAERKRRKKAAKAAIAEKEEEEEGSDYDFTADFKENGEKMDGVEGEGGSEEEEEEEEDEADDEEEDGDDEDADDDDAGDKIVAE